MQKLIIIFGIIFLTTFSGKAQDKEAFKLKANWEKGDVKEMIVQHSGSWKMNGQEQTFPMKINAKYQITILDKTEQGFVVEWKILYDDNVTEENELVKEYISQFKYEIETDLNGNFKELSNWKSLIKLNNDFIDKIILDAKKENVSQSDLDTIIAKMKLPVTKDDLITMCQGMTNIFHSIYGEEIKLNDTTLKPTIIPNEYINEGIPGTLETITKVLDKDKISIRYSNVYNYEKLKELQIKYFPDQEYTKQEINSYTEFVYNIKTGWIEKITIYNEFKYSDNENVTLIEYIIK